MPNGRSPRASNRPSGRGGPDEPQPTGPDLPRPNLDQVPEAILVDTQDGLEEMLERLADIEELAVDTEADSFYSYREKVCLIQLTYREQDWLVDPLCELDLSGLGAIFADPEVVKIFHDGEYDVMILKREYGFEFASLFDTRVAAAALGASVKAPPQYLRSEPQETGRILKEMTP